MKLEKLELEKRNVYGRVRGKMEMLEDYIKHEIEMCSAKRFDSVEDKKHYNTLTKHIEYLKGVLAEIPKIEGDILRIGTEPNTEEYEEPQWMRELLEEQFITTSEAAQKWGLDDSTIRHAIRRKRFEEGEYRKSGSIWLVSTIAMERLYGE